MKGSDDISSLGTGRKWVHSFIRINHTGTRKTYATIEISRTYGGK